MIYRIARLLENTFTFVAVAALSIMTLLVVSDVSLRYGAGEPIFFAHDVVVLYLTPALFFFGVGPTFWRDEHLAVDLFVLRLPPRLKAVSQALACLVGLIIFVLLVWVSWDRAWTSFVNAERIASIVPWPAWLSYVIVPVGSVAMVLICIIRFLLAARVIASGHPNTEVGQRDHDEDIL